MKKYYLSILSLLFIVFLCSCSTSKEEYILTQIIIDDEPISDVSGLLILDQNHSGKINVNGNECIVYWDDNPFTIRINDITAPSEKTKTGLNMYLDDNSVSLVFSIGPAVEGYQDNKTVSGKKYDGRIYFSNCDGQWKDYDGRSMYVSGTETDYSISLFSQYYSSDVPLFDITLQDGYCVNGYIMAYPLKEYDVVIENELQNADSVNNTEFLHPEEYIWNKYLEDDTVEKEEQMIDVRTLSGNCRNADGGFSYKIVLTEKTDEAK